MPNGAIFDFMPVAKGPVTFKTFSGFGGSDGSAPTALYVSRRTQKA
jgi:hypothetical protein